MDIDPEMFEKAAPEGGFIVGKHQFVLYADGILAGGSSQYWTSPGLQRLWAYVLKIDQPTAQDLARALQEMLSGE